MTKKTGIIHIVAGFAAWLSGLAIGASGGILVLAWLFDKSAPSITQDVLWVAVGIFVISAITVIVNFVRMINDI